MSWAANEEIQIFREYLRINTAHPNVNYGKWRYIKQYNTSQSARIQKTYHL